MYACVRGACVVLRVCRQALRSGRKGVDELRATLAGGKRGLRVITHCNTGSLATAQYGTALGVARWLHENDLLETLYCTETRPYNQVSGRVRGSTPLILSLIHI